MNTVHGLNNNYNFKFSIIIAVHNSELYLNKSIDSVLNQTLGFEDNIQLILVDDGSTDDSKGIILEYKDKYPNNIIVLTKERGGPASARNLGLDYAEGRYINFLDSDDYFSNNALEEVYNFFQKNRFKIDVVSIPIHYFGRLDKEHESNHMFKQNMILNLNISNITPHNSVSASFFKASAIQNIKFNEKLLVYEDSCFFDEVLLKKLNIGLLNSAKYFYRKRFDFTNLTEEFIYDKKFYTENLMEFQHELINYCIYNVGHIPKFIQYDLFNTILFFEKQPIQDILDVDELNEFLSNLRYVVGYIGDEILEKRNDSIFSDFYLYLKHNTKINIIDDKLIMDIKEFDDENLDINLHIDKFNVVNDSLIIIGNLNTHFSDEIIKLNLLLYDSENVCKKIPCPFIDNHTYSDLTDKLAFLPYNNNRKFKIEFPIQDYLNCQFNFELKRNELNLINSIDFSNSLKEQLQKGLKVSGYIMYYDNYKFFINKHFNFSIVMPLYDVENYLSEAIDSLLNQTISFEKNVQLILINDGSPDNSLKIAKNYQKRYPNNIIVISKENGGKPTALNLGLDYVTGDYVNFLDSDDYLSEEVLEEVLNFYKKYGNQVDVVTIPFIYFERMDGPHRFNYRFKETRIIDLTKEPNNPQYSVSNAFIRYDAIKNRKFDTNLFNGEDATFINKIISHKKKYGVLSKGAYYYRQREDLSSITDNSITNKRVFTEKIKYYYIALINYCLVRENKIPLYLQYVLANDLQGLLVEPEVNVFDNELEIKEFWSYLKQIITYIDYSVFMNNRHILTERVKPFFAFLKYNMEYSIKLYNNTIPIITTRNCFIDGLDQHGLWIDIVEIKNGNLNVSGTFSSSFSDESIKIFLIDNDGNRYETKYFKYSHKSHRNVRFLGIDWIYKYTFDVSIPMNDLLNKELFFEIVFNENNLTCSLKPKVIFTDKSGLSKHSPYIIKEEFILHFMENKLKILPYSYIKFLKLERHVLKNIYNDKGFNNALLYRSIYLILYPFVKNMRIWLFSDRSDFADDNATYLFKYAIQQKDNIHKYFVLDGNSKDFNKMKKLNKNIIKLGSVKHKLLYLFSEKIITSFAGDEFYNPFSVKDLELFEGLITNGVYFLQHGVTIGNQINALNKVYKNFSMILASANLEYESFLNEDYNYDDSVIQLLGMPRHDYLKNESGKQIIFMPTWRANLINEEAFVKSDYYQTLHSFLNNDRLHDLLNKYGFKVVFRPHPEISKFIDLMDISSNVRISLDTDEESYHDLFNKSALMITDYSSVFFDFGYLKKPIIYYQFDEYHYEKGYFDFETMGFGDIISNEDEVIDKIEEYFTNNCQMEGEYINRVENFFKFHDTNNSKRVYEWIKKH